MNSNFGNCMAYELDTLINIDFLFIRHGQTSWGREDIMKGPQDLQLNETGRRQAELAYETITYHQKLQQPIIYSSALKRAQETAKIFVDKASQEIPIITKEGLDERYYGDYSKATFQSYLNYKPDDAESTEVFKRRVRNTIIEIFNQPSAKNRDIIIISHQKVFEYLTEWLTNENLRLKQGCVCYFKFKDEKYLPKIYEPTITLLESY